MLINVVAVIGVYLKNLFSLRVYTLRLNKDSPPNAPSPLG
jgi:hypothetical protein